MLLEVFDQAMNPKGVIEMYDTLIWTRRFFTYGEFKLLVPCTERHTSLLTKNSIIMKDDSSDGEAGQIRNIRISFNNKGEEIIEVQGKFLARWIGKRLILNQMVVTDTAQAILTQFVTENITDPVNMQRKIPGISITSTGDLGSPVIDYSCEAGTNALTACEAVAKSADLGFKICTDPDTGLHCFTVYTGRDLTEGNGINDPCIFSFELDNMLEQEYEYSNENYRSTAYVAGEIGENQDRIVVEAGDAAEGLDREEVWINASGIKQDELTEQEYENILAWRGEEELVQYAEAIGLVNKVKPISNLVYREDYDIGDLVTCENQRWGVKADVRITEVSETYTEKGEDIDIRFGESITTIIDQIAKMGR